MSRTPQLLWILVVIVVSGAALCDADAAWQDTRSARLKKEIAGAPPSGSAGAEKDAPKRTVEIGTVPADHAVKDGTRRTWYADGNLLGECDYRDGRRHGMAKSLYRSGALMREVSWRNGVMDGPYRTFFEDNRPAEVGAYRANLRHGPWTIYFSNGQKAEDGEYADGKRVGQWTKYREDGTVFAKGAYAGEQPTGSWVIFDASGRNPIGNFDSDAIR